MGYSYRIASQYSYRIVQQMDGRQHLAQFVDECGGVVPAAESLGLPYSSFASICNGYRGISRSMAERMAKASKGKLKADLLVWIRATKHKAA